MPHWRIVAALAGLAVYALLSHLLMTYWPAQPWSVAVLFGPLLLGLAVAGVVRRQLRTLLICGLLSSLLVLTLVQGGVSVNQLYLLQHAAFNAVLGWTFGSTLRPGSKPLITALAERLHEHFSPAQAAYTRWLTGVWTVYFIAMILISLAIYSLAPWSWWSFYCSVLTPLSALALFVGEHLLRYRRHPEFERVTLAQAVRAYQNLGSAR